MLREETQVLKVVGLNPSTVYWMDIFSYKIVAKLQCFPENSKINEKEAWDSPFVLKKRKYFSERKDGSRRSRIH